MVGRHPEDCVMVFTASHVLHAVFVEDTVYLERSHSSLNSVPSPVGYEVCKWLTESINADQMTCKTYVKELEAYGLIVSERRGRG